jgi:type II secretory pathway component GspD/PulD (secretin)
MVNLNSGLANLRKKTGFTEFSTPDEYLRGFSKLLAATGTTLPPTSIWLKENGLLLVRGTPQELDAVEQTVRELNGFPSRKPREDANSGTIMDKASSTPAEIDHSTNLETRTFKVDPRTFYSGLESAGALSFGSTNISLAAKQFFTKLGLNLDPPKSVFFNDRLGVLFVRATEQDLDTVEQAIQVLNMTPPQIHIKARFIEVPEEIAKGLGTNFTPTGATNLVGILTDPNFRLALHALEQSKGVESLAEPEVTTLSGRRTQMRATEIITVITNFVFQEISTNGAITPQTEKVEVGPVLDTVASVLPDGYTIDLRAIPSLTEFLGYDKTTNTTPTITSTGKIVEVPTIRPSFCVRQAETHLQLWDGQTVVLGGLISTQIQTIKDTEPVSDSRSAATPQFRTQTTRTLKKQQLLFLITVTLVDAAGNRIHSDDEMLIARPGIPPQDSR